MWSTPLRARDLDRAIGRPVVDDQPLDDVEAGDLAREVGQRCRERRLLVEAGDLDDELHARAGRGDGACREVDAVHSLAPSIPHGERDDHPAGPGPGPCCRPPAAGARSWPVAGPGASSRWARSSGSSSTRPIPNYDSYYSLLWGRELLHGVKPSFDGYRTPTEHPLAVAFGALLSILGDPADRIMVGATLASFVVLAAGLYRLARASFGTLVGLAAAALLCTRFDFPFLAARAYIDIPYLAFVVWAAALEAERPRRGTVVFVLLACAGLMRPEAWLLSGLYWLWCIVRPPSWPQRVTYSRAAPASPPVIWTALDWWATGDPKFSLTHTSGLAEELGRTSGGLSDVPSTTVKFLKNLDKVPVFYAGILGVVIAVLLDAAARAHAARAAGHRPGHLRARRPRRAVGHRPLPARAVAAWSWSSPGVALGGWTMLRAGRARTLWAVGVGRAHRLRRGLHGHARQLLDLHQRADLPRRLARLAAGAARRPEGARRAALRPGVDAQPQADPRLALAARRARPARSSPAATRTSARASVAAWRSTRSTACRCCARASPPTTRPTEDTFNSIPMAGFTRRGGHALLQRLCPLLSRRS